MAHQSKRVRARLLSAVALASGSSVGLFGLVGHADANAIDVLLSNTPSTAATESQYTGSVFPAFSNNGFLVVDGVNPVVTIPAPAGVNYDAADTNDTGTTWNSLIVPEGSLAFSNSSGSLVTFPAEQNLSLVDSSGANSPISISEIDFTENGSAASPKNDTIHAALPIINSTSVGNTLPGTDGLGIHPSQLMGQAWLDNGTSEVITFTLSGLQQNTNYNLYVYGGGTNLGSGGTYVVPAANQTPAYKFGAPFTTDDLASNANKSIFRSVFDSSGTNPAPEQGLSWVVLPVVADTTGNLVFEVITDSASGVKGNINGFQLDPAAAGSGSLPNGAWNAPPNGTLTTASWNSGSSWANNVIPQNVGDTANFTSISTQTSVTLDANFTVGGVTFNNSAAYTVDPGAGGTLTFANTSGSAAFISVKQAANTISAPIILGSNLAISALSGTSVSITGGISSAPGTTTGLILTATGSGFLTLGGNATNSYTGATTVTSGEIKVQDQNSFPVGGQIINNGLIAIQNSTGTVAPAPIVTGAITGTGELVIGTTHGAALQIAPNSGVSSQTMVAMQTTSSVTLESQLDLTNNRFIINYGATDPVTSIAALLTSGYNAGSWTGLGIVSSTAAVNPSKFGVGYLDGNTPDDQTGSHVGVNQMILAYTLNGDAFLEGSVGFDDLVVVAQHFGLTGEDWAGGNFNYDPSGSVGFADLVNVAQNFGATSGVSEGAGGGGLSPMWQTAQATSALPEPASAALLAISAAGLLGRRRRFRGRTG